MRQRVIMNTCLLHLAKNILYSLEDRRQMVVLPVPPMDAQNLGHRLLHEHGIEIPVTTHQSQLFVRLSVPYSGR